MINLDSPASDIRENWQYCTSLTSYSRRKSLEVDIGGIPLGGENPIRIQSMTTVDTMDTNGSVEQAIRMIDAGCEYVRLTAPSLNDAQNLENIKKELRSRGYDVPLVADIHFTPNAAELAARIVEKVRVNPGNYADKKKFQQIEYTDESYENELHRIRERFGPLVEICKEYGTALRIGTNHGSLSDRIMSRYGDTPLGMVESALEFLRICEDLNFYGTVLSMKASNPQVMIQAYRLLVNMMDDEGLRPYPLHLGVTEAGEGEDGRIKSAAGIGTLLEDGLGDTIRVSLTEEPEYEVPVAKLLVDRYEDRISHKNIPGSAESLVDPFVYTKRISKSVVDLGGRNVPRVIADLTSIESISPQDLGNVGHQFLPVEDQWTTTETGTDYIYTGLNPVGFPLPGSVKEIVDVEKWKQLGGPLEKFPLYKGHHFFESEQHPELNFVMISLEDLDLQFIAKLKELDNVVLLLETENAHAMAELRQAFFKLMEHNLKTPVVVRRNYGKMNPERVQLYASTDIGGLFLDGMGDGVMISFTDEDERTGDIRKTWKFTNSTAFGILQAARVRITKTEFISCPSCGRTLFDLQKTTAMIREKTEHLKGLKIAIMGCIVNGPGEMADADYGYVGSGVDKITLYKGKEIVKRGIRFNEALEELIDLIKKEGDWIDP